MSFILDALKKSESDRQRQGGPALFEVKVAKPRGALPPWAVAIAVLFIANLALVGWLLLRRASAPPASPPVAVAAPQAAAPAARPTLTQSPPAATPAVPAVPPAAVAMNEPSAAAAPPRTPPSRTLAADEPPAPAADAPSNPDDYAPAADAPSPTGLGRVKRGTDEGVPLYQQLATVPNTQLPQLRLDLHAYADKAEDRWVMINMHKLREGESLEGVHVERITPEGAVLSFQGSQFLLTQQ